MTKEVMPPNFTASAGNQHPIKGADCELSALYPERLAEQPADRMPGSTAPGESGGP